LRNNCPFAFAAGKSEVTVAMDSSHMGARVGNVPKEKTMTIVVQNCVTKEYLSNSGRWIADASRARIFASTIDAFYFCHNRGIANSVIMLKFDRKEFDVSIPVKTTFGTADSLPANREKAGPPW
jgi:hypothetical protein